jgi:type I restriction enzyme, S subunit
LALSPYFQKLIFSSTTGAGREGLPKYNLERFLVPIPPLSEQKAIVAKVEGLLGNISLLESENKAQQIDVQRLMGAVLQEAFGGR